MNLTAMFKSIIDTDRAPVVVCDTDNIIVYMNPSAVKQYEKRGGAALVGRNLYACHNEESRRKMDEVLNWFKKDAANNIVYTYYNEKQNKDVYMVALRDDGGKLLGYYEKHEYRNRESAKLYDLK